MSSVTSVRGLTEINIETSNSLIITFTTTNPLVNGDQFYIIVPNDQMLPDTGSGKFICFTSVAGGSYQAQTCTLSTTAVAYSFVVTMPAPCSSGCPAVSTFSVLFEGVINPSWIENPVISSIQIKTMTSDLLYTKDKQSTGIYTTPTLT